MAFEIEQSSDLDGHSAVVEPTKPRLLGVLCPGLITGASDDDPWVRALPGAALRATCGSIVPLAPHSNCRPAADRECHQYRRGPRRYGRRLTVDTRRSAGAVRLAVRGHLHRTSDFPAIHPLCLGFEIADTVSVCLCGMPFRVNVPWSEAAKASLSPRRDRGRGLAADC